MDKKIYYDYHKTMYTIFFAATIAICLGIFGVIIAGNNQPNFSYYCIIISGTIAALISLLKMSQHYKIFYAEYKKAINKK